LESNLSSFLLVARRATFHRAMRAVRAADMTSGRWRSPMVKRAAAAEDADEKHTGSNEDDALAV
jgi:hypothetical protein